MGDNEQFAEGLEDVTPQEQGGVGGEQSEEGAAPELAEEAPDIDSLRKQIDDFKGENDDLKRQVEFFKVLAMQGAQRQPEREPERRKAPTIDPILATTGEDVTRYVEDRIDPLQREIDEAKETSRVNKILIQESIIRNQVADYDVVINKYAKDLFSKDPRLHKMVMESDNPAYYGYIIGAAHPEYLKTKNKQGSAEAGAIAAKNLQKPTALGTVGGKTVPPKKSFDDMSDEEFELEIQRAKRLIR